MVVAEGRIYWRWTPPSLAQLPWPTFTRADDPTDPLHVDARTTEQARLKTLVKGFGLDPGLAVGATPVTAFDDEYGAHNKRLPVWRIAVPDQGVWFFETASGSLAAQVQPADRRNDWIFTVFPPVAIHRQAVRQDGRAMWRPACSR